MSWNYRIVRYLNGKGFGLHEVYYDDEGEPRTMTAEPDGFMADPEDGPEEIQKALRDALRDTKRMPVFDEPETWPGQNPSDQKETT